MCCTLSKKADLADIAPKLSNMDSTINNIDSYMTINCEYV